MAELHAKWSTLSPEALSALKVHPKDQIARWARDYLLRSPASQDS